MTRNFDLIKERLLEITGQSPSYLDTPPARTRDQIASIKPTQTTISKRSVVSSIFKFLFGGEDN